MILLSLFFLINVICEDEHEISSSNLPFDLIDLHRDWITLITHSSGIFSEKDTQYQFSPKVNMFVYKVNGSVGIETNSLHHISRLYHANISNNKIELFDTDLTCKAILYAFKLDNQTVTIRGSSPNGEYTVFGHMSPFQKSLITITSTKSDDVYIIRGIPPHIFTASEIINRILPSIAIVVFMGFGRIYRARFWRQYSQMNTRTLQNKIDKASKPTPK